VAGRPAPYLPQQLLLGGFVCRASFDKDENRAAFARLRYSSCVGEIPDAWRSPYRTPSRRMTASAHRTPARQACCGVAEEAGKSSARFTSWRRALAARAAAFRYASKPRMTELRKIFIAAQLRSRGARAIPGH
jgi:hypothetical protein